MRVIAGEFRSRPLKTLPGSDVRPTPDRLRESLFNILAPRIEGSVFVDAYAGTGAVGIEALSRGASRAIFLERSKAAAAVLRDNLSTLGLGPRSAVIFGKVLQHLRDLRADIVFLDPPYPLEKEYGEAMQILGEAPPPLVIVQHSSRFKLEPVYDNLQQFRQVRQGDNTLSFYEPAQL
jgi:16S rRNA (guanine966-N2)-methyltransferase